MSIAYDIFKLGLIILKILNFWYLTDIYKNFIAHMVNGIGIITEISAYKLQPHH